MAYWAVSRLAPNRERLALYCLALAGFETYLPRLRVPRVSPRGRKFELRPPLFPGYCFVLIELQWHAARWAPGTWGLIMDGVSPAKVPERVIDEIHRREVNGLIEIPKPSFRHGSRVRILHGPFRGHLAIFTDMKPRDRVEVLLRLLGSRPRVTLAKQDVEAL
jgi:transcription antitermination factor NusG